MNVNSFTAESTTEEVRMTEPGVPGERPGEEKQSTLALGNAKRQLQC